MKMSEVKTFAFLLCQCKSNVMHVFEGYIFFSTFVETVTALYCLFCFCFYLISNLRNLMVWFCTTNVLHLHVHPTAYDLWINHSSCLLLVSIMTTPPNVLLQLFSSTFAKRLWDKNCCLERSQCNYYQRLQMIFEIVDIQW